MGHLVLGAPSDAAPVEAPAEPRLVRAVGAARGGGGGGQKCDKSARPPSGHTVTPPGLQRGPLALQTYSHLWTAKLSSSSFITFT